MAGLGAKDILRNITALEQLIEEINFQRAKEMRQCLMSKDTDTSFVIVHGTTYWTDLFVRHFLFQNDRSTDADDLLFFIRKKQVRGSRYIPKYHTEVEVYRKDSRKLPIGDPDVDWEETVYLNLIIHQFDYTLTLAICTRTSPKELQVLKRHSQKVYASPSRRRMDTKGEVEEITYPNVCFHVDNFDEVFADMLVRDGEMVCVELVAADHSGSRQAVIFLGSIRYDALKRVYDTRASLSSKVAQRMMLCLFSGSGSQRIEFVRMKGPQGKGHAEMAVTKPKGSGVETPTSEPGVSLTDLWDSDWEDEPEDRFLYRHQRRLSDPSANFNTFINSGWVSKAESKSRSENEGLDNFANGLYEIESGDVRDAMCSCRCSVVACGRSVEEDAGRLEQEEDCRRCQHYHGRQRDESHGAHSPPSSFSPHQSGRRRSCGTHLEGRGFDESGRRVSARKRFSSYGEVDPELVVGVEALAMEQNLDWKPPAGGGSVGVKAERSESPCEEDPLLIPAVVTLTDQTDLDSPPRRSIDLAANRREKYSKWSSRKGSHLKKLFKKRTTPGSAVRVEAPPVSPPLSRSAPTEYIPLSTTEDPVVITRRPSVPSCEILPPLSGEELITSSLSPPNWAPALTSGPIYLHTFLVAAKRLEAYLLRAPSSLVKSRSMEDLEASHRKRRISTPFRVTKDGTKVHFPCDTKLDDGAYNPLWTTKGFTQTFHFWKESRRAGSVPLNAYLTYVTLPWFTIITDILDHRSGPILTF